MTDLPEGNPMHAACPLCGGAELEDRYDIRGFTLARCAACTLLFVKNRCDDAYLSRYYRQAASAVGHERVYVADANKRFLDFAYSRLARRIKKILGPGPRRLLDLGCSAGGFFDHFPGWDLYGVELSERDGRSAREKYPNVFIGDMRAAPFERGFFDCVVLQDSLDHSNDPLGVVRHVHGLLKPGGLIVIKVHNVSCWLAKLSGRRFYAFLPPGHLFYFDLATLKRLLDACGFSYGRHYFNTHKLQTGIAFMRMSQDDPDSWFYKISMKLASSPLGRIPVYKNLHDLITVFGVKRN